ncbi:MAG: LysR family transcriptional regulator ArgP [Rhodoglobus sp.]
MTELQLDHLATLIAVIEEGTFEAASQRLRITASAVSQRIKAMEQSAGQVLVQRTNPIAPTEAGSRLLRYAQQLQLLRHDLEASLGSVSTPSLAIAVNADSLATWLLPALATAQDATGAVFDIYREDQEHTASLLRAGTVMAAVTAEKRPVQGCSASPLGMMRYRAVATPSFRDRWLDDDLSALDNAPMVDFDRKDDLQQSFLRGVLGRTPRSPRHFVPTSHDFARAVELGMGWGMLPDQQSERGLREGSLVELSPGISIDVLLYWQRWNLASPLLDELTRVVLDAASTTLPQP